MRAILESRLFYQLKYASNFHRVLVTLITFTLVIYMVLIPTARKDLGVLTNISPFIKSATEVLPQGENQKAHSFYQQLPNGTEVKEILVQFYNIAEAQGLEVSTVQYTLDELPEVSFAAYRLSAPIFGEYLDIMQLVKAMLESYPTLALSQLRLIREDKKENLVSAELEFVIYMKKDN